MHAPLALESRWQCVNLEPRKQTTEGAASHRIQITLVRLRGVDAPELKARCGEELRGAEAARDTLAGYLAAGGVSIDDVALDKYGGRVVASLFVDRGGDLAPLDVARAMIEAGMARAYGGGKREAWCPLPRVARG